jgi:hypothetical protein
MPGTLAKSSGADLISAVAAMSKEERVARLDQALGMMAAAQGEVVAILGEIDRGQEFRDEGATSTESWLVERFGVSTATARALTHVGEKAWDLPHLVGGLRAGEISFDKVRALADVATPESDRGLCDQARGSSVRELAELARSAAELARRGSPSRSGSEHDGRYLRCNDEHRTISAQLPAESYAQTKACLNAQLKELPSGGETSLDQRRCDAFIALVHSAVAGSVERGTTASPFVVVAHVPLAVLAGEAGEHSALAGELEGGGLIDAETVRRIACDATVVIALDDDVGHTMYEGRARRFPSDAQRREVMRRDRRCRFPGCANKTFTNVHHIVAWQSAGRTDLDNLALVCLHHHHLVHANKGWTVSGDANAELRFVGPSGRVMTSRPSALWSRVKDLAAGPQSG